MSKEKLNFIPSAEKYFEYFDLKPKNGTSNNN